MVFIVSFDTKTLPLISTPQHEKIRAHLDSFSINSRTWCWVSVIAKRLHNFLLCVIIYGLIGWRHSIGK